MLSTIFIEHLPCVRHIVTETNQLPNSIVANLQKTSRIQPHVPPPWSKSTSYVACFIGHCALARVPLLPLLNIAARAAWGNEVRSCHSHWKPWIAALCIQPKSLQPSAAWPPRTPWLFLLFWSDHIGLLTGPPQIYQAGSYLWVFTKVKILQNGLSQVCLWLAYQTFRFFAGMPPQWGNFWPPNLKLLIPLLFTSIPVPPLIFSIVLITT